MGGAFSFWGPRGESMDQSKKDQRNFKSFKQRGEWVELRFMAAAAERGFHVLKPWGDTRPYDVGIDHSPNFLRVQVKSTTCRTGTGYFCQFKPHYLKKQDYTLAQLDLFAAYVIPVETWYLIPAALLLGAYRKTGLMLYPVEPLKKDRYSYEVQRSLALALQKPEGAGGAG
jgi:hypothetical protein